MFLYGTRQSTIFYAKHSYSCQFTYAIYWTAFMVLLLLLKEKSCFLEIMNLSILKKFGKFSFGIYLLHVHGLIIEEYIQSKIQMNSGGLEKIILVITICYGLGLLFYHLIEVPSINLGNCLIKKITLI